ncbi:hypothetical protein TSUD_291950 [Trifolium subterraneum]|uniref:START domain-containing protein n=1 Tax=Trifolium subterraneum TaxID=3900 RepID=A0A2Z6P7Z3_TRISU|nr:hypothetical protein TSUD_291950 [Trifolium subterraneum]
MEANGEMGLIGENFDSGLMGRMRDDDFDSRSGSENFDASGDEFDAGDDQQQNKRKKKYHRHTPQQIQELESYTQLERHENMILRQENEKLRAENSVMKEAMSNPICSNCGGPAIPGQVSMEEHQIRIENARLKEELARVNTLSSKFLGRPVSALSAMSMQNPNLGLEYGMGRNGVVGPSNFNMSLPMGFDMGNGVMGAPPPNSVMQSPMGMIGNDAQQERSMLIELALAAMNELIKMSEPDSHLWIKSPDSGKDDRWSEMFPCMIAQAATLDVLSTGMGGSRNGSMQVMHAEIQLPSPFVPVRQYSFLRFCKQHAEGVWVVADVSVDLGRNGPNGNSYMSSKKLPSGCILQDLPNGLCKITWVDHSQYDETAVHQTCRQLVNSGFAFGAHRWVATLQRHCEALAILMSSVPADDPSAITPSAKRSMTKLAQRMSDYFWSGVCPSSACKWDILHITNMGNSDMRIMSRKIPDASGENPSIVLSAATSVWMPVSRQRVFDILRDAQLRGEWDILSNGGSMQEMVHIATGQVAGNSVSILRANNAANGNEGNVLYLQDSWTDSSGSMVVYSPINMQSLSLVMSGGDSSCVALLPSGFSILPDGHSSNNSIVGTSSDGSSSSGNDNDNGGCLLTVGLQMVLSNLQSSKLTTESVDTVNDLIANTVQKVKDALGVA